MAITLNYKKPVITAQCNPVHIYHVYKDYMNGAWFNEEQDRWVPSQWTLSGYFIPSLNEKQPASNLDLKNNDYI